MVPSAFDLRAKIALAITDVLAAHGIHETITWDDIDITDAIVTDGLSASQKLSPAIISKLWPPVRAAEVYHYTSREAAESILLSQRFRLTNIGKRITEGEIKTFCDTHGLSGFTAQTNGHPNYRTLIEPNTFYASFTDANIDEAEERAFWQAFGCVRLRLNVVAQNSDFRRIYYEDIAGGPIPVIAALAKRIRTDFNREWVLAGISRICSFYLPRASYGWEKELRVLWRTWNGSPCQSIGTGPESYVELPLGVMSPCGFQLSVNEVCAEDHLAVPSGVAFVRRTP